MINIKSIANYNKVTIIHTLLSFSTSPDTSLSISHLTSYQIIQQQTTIFSIAFYLGYGLKQSFRHQDPLTTKRSLLSLISRQKFPLFLIWYTLQSLKTKSFFKTNQLTTVNILLPCFFMMTCFRYLRRAFIFETKINYFYNTLLFLTEIR